MKKVLYLDLDGVLVDFVGGALAAHGRALPPKEIDWGFPSQIGFRGADDPLFWEPLGYSFWSGLGWTREGGELLSGLEHLYGDEIVLMTSPCDTEGSVEGKVAWIKRNAPRYSRRFFVGPAKHLAAGPGKILIDDHDPNCARFAAAGGFSLTPPRPWNSRINETDARGNFDVHAFLAEASLALGAA